MKDVLYPASEVKAAISRGSSDSTCVCVCVCVCVFVCVCHREEGVKVRLAPMMPMILLYV